LAARCGVLAFTALDFVAGRDFVFVAAFAEAFFMRTALFALTGFALAFFALDFGALDCLAMD
jgi:hypothetical protein